MKRLLVMVGATVVGALIAAGCVAKPVQSDSGCKCCCKCKP